MIAEIQKLTRYRTLECLENTAHLFVDAEWEHKTRPGTKKHPFGGKEPVFISVQWFALDKDWNPLAVIYFLNEKYPEPTTLPCLSHDGANIPIVLLPVEEEVFAEGLFNRITAPKSNVDVYGFYSPMDYAPCIGTQNYAEWFLQKGDAAPRKKRKLSGTFSWGGRTCTLRDLFGLANTSLERYITNFGTPMGKGMIEKWNELFHHKNIKSVMGIPAKHDPDGFALYAIGDVIDLHHSVWKHCAFLNLVVCTAHGFDPGYTPDNVPLTSGKLVWETFHRFLKAKYPDIYTTTIRLTDTFSDKYFPVVRKLRKETDVDTYRKTAEKRTLGNNIIQGLGVGSINGVVKLGLGSSGVAGAVVHGGRCINEEWKPDPYAMRINNVVDIDISSCYGTALANFEYPFGIPTVIGYDVDNPSPTLGEFLAEHEKELVDGLYAIYLTTDGESLSFRQDLFLSKYKLDTRKIVSTVIKGEYETSELDVDAAHLKGEMRLTKRELNLAVLTSESLKVLRAVATNQELNEFMTRVKVQAAAYYPKSKRVSREEFVSTDFGKTTRLKNGQLSDNRSRVWTSISMGEFINPFIRTRKEYQAKKNAVEKGSAEYNQADGTQNTVKLFINTTYGCLASPFFPMGNVVLANNITDRARVGVWLLSKALLTVQSITDGGMFSASRVAVLDPKGKRPGLDALADRDRYLSHRAVKTVNLFPEKEGMVRDWFDLKDPAHKELLNARCLEHVNQFWSPYGVVLPFSLECKLENLGRGAVWAGAGDYLIYDVLSGNDEVTMHGKTVKATVKCRGAKEVDHPKRVKLKHLACPEEYPYPDPLFLHTRLVGVTEFQHHGDPEEIPPGAEVVELTIHKSHAVDACPVDTWAEAEAIAKSEEVKRTRYDKPFKADNYQALVTAYETTNTLPQPQPYNVQNGRMKRARNRN